jgi:hypothetical protein
MKSKNMRHDDSDSHQNKMSRTQQRLSMLIVIGIVCATTGCSVIRPVQAWDKGYLAKNSMKFDYDKLAMKNGEHIYTSKEAASGSSSVGGGGCGCN